MANFDNLLALADSPPTGAGGRFVAVNDGSWFDASTWEGGRVPGAGAFVTIEVGVEVQYDDVSDVALAMVRVDGALTFATDVDTRMVVDTLAVNETVDDNGVNVGGRLTIGTAAETVAADVTAEVLFKDSRSIDRIDRTAGDIDNDPTQLSLGLISHGEVSIFGAEKTAHLKVATDPMAGARSITLDTVPTGWRVGDTIVVTGTHFVPPRADADPTDVAGTYATQDETFTITAIQGDRVSLSGALQFDHDTPAAEFKASVANMTRNVEFRSVEPDDIATRGHTMFMHASTVAIHDAAFTDLGRTDKSRDLDDFVLEGDGTGEDFRAKAGGYNSYEKTPAADVTNIRGRYALHLHKTGNEPGGQVAVLEGNVVSGSPGWGIVQHDSAAILRDNIAYANFGAGFVSETGNESGAWVGNLAIRTAGRRPLPGNNDEGDVVLEKDQARNQDFGVTGTGFWFQGTILAAVDNISASAAGSAYFFLHRGVDDIPTDVDNLDRPEIAEGLDAIISNRPGIELFKGNEAYAGSAGLTIVGDDAPRVYNDDRSVLEDFSAWEFGRLGVHFQYTTHYTLDNFTLYGTTGAKANLTIGIKLGTSLDDVIVKDSFIANVPRGIFTRDDYTEATQINFWGRVDQNRVDRITDHGYRYIDVGFQNVEQNYDGRNGFPGQIFKPIPPIIIDSRDLPALPLRLTLDDASLKTTQASMGGVLLDGAWLSGTKTDSLGTVSFPAYQELIYVSDEQINGLLTGFGYFTVGAKRVLLLDTLYSDRVSGEQDILTHTLELDPDWTLPPGARSLGALPDVTRAQYFTLVFRENDPALRFVGENDVYYAAGLRSAGLVDTVMLRGSGIADALIGDASPDLMLGNGGDDTLVGNAGNDTLIGGDYDDSILGGIGSDRLHGDDGQDVLQGGDGDDTVTGDAGNDTLFGNAGLDSLDGGLGDDRLTGDDTAGGGNDTLTGGGGADTLVGLTGADQLGGDAGDDRLDGGNGNDALLGGSENDRLLGGAGNDQLGGELGDDTLDGGSGNDRLDGGIGDVDLLSFASANVGITASLATGRATGAGNDTIIGFEQLEGSRLVDLLIGDVADNTLWGGNGDDVLEGGNGNDLLDGGAGFDIASYAGAASSVMVFLTDQGSQIATRSAGFDRLLGIEGLLGSNFADTLTGDIDANLLAGGGGDDRLLGGGGADTLDGGSGVADIADFGALGGGLAFVQKADGTGSFTGGFAGTGRLLAIDEVWGTAGNNRFSSDSGGHVFRGLGGNDTVDGGGGTDRLDGGEGLDTLFFGEAAAAVSVSFAAHTASIGGIAGVAFISNFDVLVGSAFKDALAGDSADNTVRGGAGADTLTGGGGDDRLDGGDGDDVLIGAADGNDVLAGGAGFDTASFAGAAGGVTVTIQNGVQNIGGRTVELSDIEALIGSGKNDRLTASAIANSLFGGGGDDSLNGGAGNDTLDGGASLDTLQGGSGDDLFVFTAGGGTDRVLDFGGGDRLSFQDFGRDYDSFGEILATARLFGDAVQLRLNNPTGGTMTVNLVGITIASLDPGDFLFV